MSANFTGSREGRESGNFKLLSEMVASDWILEGTVATVFEQENRGAYFITAIDEGGGVLLNNGLYANLYGGGTVLPELAPDLNFASTRSANTVFKTISGIDAVGALTPVLSLTGKFVISYILLSDLTANDVSKIKLTIDGEVKWSETLTSNNLTILLFGMHTNALAAFESYICNESFLLEIQTVADNDTSISYLVRPIL